MFTEADFQHIILCLGTSQPPAPPLLTPSVAPRMLLKSCDEWNMVGSFALANKFI